MMPERRPLGELADELQTWVQQRKVPGRVTRLSSEYTELLDEAADRLREFEGTVIEGWVWPEAKRMFAADRVRDIQVYKGAADHPEAVPLLLILTKPQEPDDDD